MLRLILATLFSLALPHTVSAETLTLKIIDAKGDPVQGAVMTYTPTRYDGPSADLNKALVINQADLKFKPFITLAPVGATIAFKNEDSVLHHVFSFSKPKRFDLKLFGRDEPQEVTFENPGIVTIGCNIHDGMISHIFLSDAPFAGQSDSTGTIRVENVPTGAGELLIWHPLLKQRNKRIVQDITVAASPEPILIEGKFRRGLRQSSEY